MAERIVSPGVFTIEKDQSFLQRGIGEIGAAIVGPTIKGPALIPTVINSFSEFEEIFGSYTEESYLPYTVQEYMKNSGTMTITRLLYEDGYALKNGALAVVAQSGSGAGLVKYVTHLLHPTIPVQHVSNTTNVFEDSSITDNNSGSFSLTVSGSFLTDSDVPGFSAFTAAETASVAMSLNSSDNNYITKVLGTNPKNVSYPVYVQYENRTAFSLFGSAAKISMSLAVIDNYQFTTDYQTAKTPYITSQKIGSTAVNLFRFCTLSHGDVENVDVKIGIRDIKEASEVSDPNGYGTFTVEIRKVNSVNLPNSPFDSDDTDKAPEIVESFNGCNLDPDSVNYILKRIGDQYREIDGETGKIYDYGDYPNLSKYVRVEATDGVSSKTNDATYIPFGFRALNSPIPDASGSAGNLNLYPAQLITSQNIGSYSPKNYHGFSYTDGRNLNYLAPLPNSGSNTGSNSDFYLGDAEQDVGAAFPSLTAPYTGSIQAALVGSGLSSNILLATRKFMVPFQGGFDGARPNLPKFTGNNIKGSNTFGFDCSSATSTGTKSYQKAFAALSNTDFYDMNMLLTPGIIHRLHSAVTSEARQLAEDRADTFYIMDTTAERDSIATATSQVTSLDSNYTATYYPWVKIVDPVRNKPMWVPPSVVVPGALSFNDAVSAPWYAPAGLNRGGLNTVINTYEKLTQSDRDDLYQDRVNPIANFPNEGICIWGQKTLQARPSALDRVNVRRLLIAVKKFIASATKYLVFEQNTDATRARFLNIANPYLESVRAQQGLSAFRVVMDATNNTPDLIDQNILYGQIFLQPTRTAEFIVLDFNIQPTGASFPE
jgi:hypothetical protein